MSGAPSFLISATSFLNSTLGFLVSCRGSENRSESGRELASNIDSRVLLDSIRG